MSLPNWARLGGFALAALAVFTGGLAAGRLTGGVGPVLSARAADAPTRLEPAGLASQVTGVSMSDGGFTLAADSVTVPVATPGTLRLRVLGPDGRSVLRYGLVGDRLARLHLVRRDLTGMRALAPALQADGVWTVPVTVPEPGSWRLIADLAPITGDTPARPVTLGLDLSAPGVYTPHPPQQPTPDTTVDGYTITLGGSLRPGQAQPLLFTVRHAGARAAGLETAAARLMLLRDGDLAVLQATADPAQPGPATLRFWVNPPSPGRYAAYLHFTTGGTGHLAPFAITIP